MLFFLKKGGEVKVGGDGLKREGWKLGTNYASYVNSGQTYTNYK